MAGNCSMMAYTRMGHISQDAIVPLHLSEATTLTCSVSLKSGESSSLLESSRRRCSLRLCFGDAIWMQHRGDSIMSDTRSGLDRILFTQDTEQASLRRGSSPQAAKTPNSLVWTSA